MKSKTKCTCGSTATDLDNIPVHSNNCTINSVIYDFELKGTNMANKKEPVAYTIGYEKDGFLNIFDYMSMQFIKKDTQAFLKQLRLVTQDKNFVLVKVYLPTGKSAKLKYVKD